MTSAAVASALPITVWLVEDEPYYRDAMAFVLGNAEGFRCGATFSEGEEAVTALVPGADLPDVLLVDHQLPGMSGVDVVAHVVRTGLPVRGVLLTNVDRDVVIYEAFCAGASGYLLKNAPVQKILAAIQEAHEGGMLMPPAVASRVLQLFRQPAVPDYGLSAREREVLGLMAEGLMQREMAERLFLSVSTVNEHVQHIYSKLHVRTVGAAVSKAVRERLV